MWLLVLFILTSNVVTNKCPCRSNKKSEAAMRTLFTLITTSALMLSACSVSKNFEVGDRVTENKYDKLVRGLVKNPADTALANKVNYAYGVQHQQLLNNIARLQTDGTLQAKERLLHAYIELQNFYIDARQNSNIAQLVQPGNVQADIDLARYRAADAWYEYGMTQLGYNDWQHARTAYNAFRKVENWESNYKNTLQNLNEAWETGTIDAVIQPLRNEGFYQHTGYNNNGYGFTSQLTSDLARRGNSDMYRVYTADEAYRTQRVADWNIEPLWTNWQVGPYRINETKRTVTKQKEIGRDSLKNPIYKTITAVLTIKEAYIKAEGTMEARISNMQNGQLANRRSWCESYTWREQWATYTGDGDALSSSDWDLVRNKRSDRPNEFWMQEKIKEQIYPQMLNYLRNELRG